jgi:hypothetical protein
MNGLTEHELKTRKAIRELINGGEYIVRKAALWICDYV